MTDRYAHDQPRREDIDALPGPVLLDFGTDWCGYCRAAHSLVVDALADHPRVRHVMVEDAPGRALGRSFRVKLWPTLIFLRDGREVARAVRPMGRAAIEAGLAQITGELVGSHDHGSRDG